MIDPRDDTSEATIEKYLVDAVRKIGGRCIKLLPDYAPGIPDRMCLFRGGRVVFVEVKRPKGGRLGPKQVEWGAWLTSAKHEYRVVKNCAEVWSLIEDIRGTKGEIR